MSHLKHALLCAKYLFLRHIRAKIYIAILAASFALSIASIVLEELSGGEGGRIVFDLGTFSVALMVCVLALVLGVLSSGRMVMADGVTILSRPVARGSWVLGSFLASGTIIVLSALLLGSLGALYFVAAAHQLPLLFLLDALMSACSALTILAAAIAFGSWLSESAAVSVGVLYFIAGSFIEDADILVRKNILGPMSEPVVAGLKVVVVNLRRFDLATAFHSGAMPSLSTIGMTTLYAVMVCAAALLIGIAGLRRRQF